METENNGVLSDAEQAYFDSRGETPIETETPPPQDTVEPVTPAEATEQPADTIAGEAEPEEQKTVPLAALREEREKRKKAQEEARKRETDFARLQGRLETLERLAKEPEKPAAPDPLQTLERLDAKEREREQARIAEQEQAAITSRYLEDARSFAAETADFKEAYQHVVDSRVRELQLQGWPLIDAQAQAQRDEVAIARIALQRGERPAQVIYELAKARGYARKEPAKQVQTPSEKLETVTKGQQAARSLSNAAGGTPKPGSLEALLHMSDDEFDEATSGKNWRKLMGG